MANFTPIAVPLINGAAPSFGHIQMEIAGLDFTGGFKSIKYKRERKRDKVMSNSPDPVAQTQGENTYTASAVVYWAWWLALLRTVRAQIGPGYGDITFTTLVSYTPNGFDPSQDVILGCHFDSTDADQSAGTGPLERTIDLNPIKILFDGVDDLEEPLQGNTG